MQGTWRHGRLRRGSRQVLDRRQRRCRDRLDAHRAPAAGEDQDRRERGRARPRRSTVDRRSARAGRRAGRGSAASRARPPASSDADSATGIDGLGARGLGKTSASGTSASSASTTSSTPKACHAERRSRADVVPAEEQRAEQQRAPPRRRSTRPPRRRRIRPAPAARAAASVLRSSIAIVIGPTPRGTGVMQRGALGRRRRSRRRRRARRRSRLIPTSITVAPVA